ncbi:MAG TPA: hypothetical protein VF062_09960 [Candidatus Limnocylindrales bacterium]
MTTADQFSMDFKTLEERSDELNNRVSGLVTKAFAAAPAAAQAAAGANMNYMTAAAVLASFGQMAVAIKQLTAHTQEHAKLLKTTAEQVRGRDAEVAARDFSADTILPNADTTLRKPGGTNA